MLRRRAQEEDNTVLINVSPPEAENRGPYGSTAHTSEVTQRPGDRGATWEVLRCLGLCPHPGPRAFGGGWASPCFPCIPWQPPSPRHPVLNTHSQITARLAWPGCRELSRTHWCSDRSPRRVRGARPGKGKTRAGPSLWGQSQSVQSHSSTQVHL